ncbi:hypothetical protein ANA_P30004 (plasmid) [Anabaena sp. 90]|nr:hypothetical protein ANA_P30004 [Anabaena sp. 90]
MCFATNDLNSQTMCRNFGELHLSSQLVPSNPTKSRIAGIPAILILYVQIE